jgi:hypothetical protein
MYQWSSWKMPKIFVWNTIKSKKPFSISMNLLNYVSHGLNFPNGFPLTDASRALTVVSTCRAWFSSHRSWDVNWFSKQSAITLVFSFWFVWYVILKGPWITVGAFGPSLFIRDFVIRHRAWGVTSHCPTFVSHRSSAFLRVICLMVLEIQLPCRLS